jgi:TATA-binding protein-associated factor
LAATHKYSLLIISVEISSSTQKHTGYAEHVSGIRCRYQQEGINWLAFLKRFKLHGILCDDMGLGKTLQASAILASDTAERLKNTEVAPLPSLVVCPPTLVGHWAFEIEKFIPSDILNPLQYAGSVPERASLRTKFQNHNVIVTSYDVLRKDVDILAQQVWNYCILDEGHIIKSAKSKITQAAKRIQADHRLILTGTPIQNNVLELWSLFDFLMPGFLGTERQVLHSNLFGILSSELFVGNRQLDCTFLCPRSQWKIGPSP